MLKIFTSTRADGSMKNSEGDDVEVFENRKRFLLKHDINPSDATLVWLTYDSEDYRRYHEVGDDAKGCGVLHFNYKIGDALITQSLNHALYLPLADCVGAVLYDSRQNILMMSHLGRHSLEQNGGEKSVSYLINKFGSKVDDINVWLSPAASREAYPLLKFNNLGLHEVAIGQIVNSGVPFGNIKSSEIDTTKDTDYYSHSNHLKGVQADDGRFMIVAVMAD